jgi:SPP1 family predicted phage head-tail adaptor
VNIGDLSERVTFQTLSEAPNAGTGGLTPTYATLFEAWANVRAARPGRFIDDHQVDDFATHTFLIRYAANWRDARFILWNSRRWRVTGGTEIEHRRWVSVAAVEEGPAT